MPDVPLIQIAHLSKSYGGVRALHDVSLNINTGEIHALCGENGAGKSTLIKALTGVITPDAGTIHIAGQPLPFAEVVASESLGVAVMHQESTAFPDLNAVDNIYVGRELTRARGCLLDRREMKKRTAALFEKLGERVNLSVPVGELSVAQRQIVAMARAMSRDCRLLIMDEPTASLSARETETLLARVRQLRAQGVSVLYVSHRLEEVFTIADRVTVLRDGELVETRDIEQIDREQLIRLMVGRQIEELTHRHDHQQHRQSASPILQVTHLTRQGVFHDINLTIHAGEIVGLAGLVGAGRSEVARAIFGIDPYDQGSVKVDARIVPPHSVRAAMSRGLALVPEDRQHEGLVLPMSVAANLSMTTLHSLARAGFISPQRESELIQRQITDLNVKAQNPAVPAETLSGGNQQKLVIGKWLARRPRVLILDEPTRGVDVAAKAQVHRLIRELAAQGLATLIISSELPEILTVCDRILTMRQGRISGELKGASATQQQILSLVLPLESGEPAA